MSLVGEATRLTTYNLCDLDLRVMNLASGLDPNGRGLSQASSDVGSTELRVWNSMRKLRRSGLMHVTTSISRVGPLTARGMAALAEAREEAR
jgi:hypothetical protein